MLVFVLGPVLEHGLFDTQAFGASVGQQRIITALSDGRIEGILIETEMQFKVIGNHLGFLNRIHFRGATPMFVFVGDNASVDYPEGEKRPWLGSFHNSFQGLLNLLATFELSVVELTFHVLESFTGLGDSAFKPFSFDTPQVVVEKDDYAKSVILFLLAHRHRYLETPVDPVFV